jgi:energy-coupling factor transporter ATP-binding protein EcfA2
MAAVIACAGLSKRYASGVLGLDDVTLEVPAGVAMGLLGQNGAGKSPLIKLILGFLHPTGGCLEVLGGERVERAHGRIGYLPEGRASEPGLTGRAWLRHMARAAGLRDVNDAVERGLEGGRPGRGGRAPDVELLARHDAAGGAGQALLGDHQGRLLAAAPLTELRDAGPPVEIEVGGGALAGVAALGLERLGVELRDDRLVVPQETSPAATCSSRSARVTLWGSTVTISGSESASGAR